MNSRGIWRFLTAGCCAWVTTSASLCAEAQSDAKSAKSMQDRVISRPFEGTGLTVLFGVGLGGVATLSDDTKYESNKYGYEIHGKAGLSLFVEKAAIEAAGGWYINDVRGKAARERSAKGLDQNEVHTQAAIAEVSASYRNSPAWMFGPVAQVRFGADTTLSPYVEDDPKPSVLAGLQFAFGQPEKVGDFRWTYQILTDLNVNDRRVVFMCLSFSFGVPIVKPDVVIRKKNVVTIKEKPVNRIVYKIVYVLDSQVVNFATGSARLLDASSEFLRNLGSLLKENSDLWSSVLIEGHTDSRGDSDYNMQLSRDRADQVKVGMMIGGIDASRIRTRGYGASKPMVKEGDERTLAQNRRVEMMFEGVKNPARMKALIDQLRKESQDPATCGEDGCK